MTARYAVTFEFETKAPLTLRGAPSSEIDDGVRRRKGAARTAAVAETRLTTHA